MTDAALSYEKLEARLLRGRVLDVLPEATDDAILEAMDALWRLMTMEERTAAEARVQAARRASAPDSLNLCDIPLSEGESGLPREAA